MKIINPLLYQQVYNTATSIQQIAVEDIEIKKYEEEDDSNENNESSSL